VSNRGHDSIACFSFDPDGLMLTPVGHVPTGPVPRAFSLDRSGRFVCAASQESGALTVAAIPERGEEPSTLITYKEFLTETANPLWVCLTPRASDPR